MSLERSPANSSSGERPWRAATAICLAWMTLLALAISRLKTADGMLVALLAALPVGCTLMVCARNRRKPRAEAIAHTPGASEAAATAPGSATGALGFRSTPALPAQAPTGSMTRSGLFDSPTPVAESNPVMALSGNFSIIDMVSRLEPRGFHWIESSLAEQEFLGWTLAELQRKSFLDIVHPDDRERAAEALRLTLIKGESLGLIIRIRTAQDKTKAIEVNAGARYTSTHQVSYLRCHVADVTAKVHAERELRLRTHELIQVNEQLRRINRELEELKESLAHANAELARKNRELDEFVYVVSHDLQEPLRTLTAFADFLLQDHAEQLDSEGHQYVLRLAAASGRMRSMIDGLLTLSRAGKVTDEFGLVPLAELVADARADLGELIRSRQAELRLVSPDVVLWGDRRRLLQLLANLVSNGIKYNASANPCVEIGVIAPADDRQTEPGSPGPWLTLIVRDNGIGIAPRHHQRIFQLFRRLHSQEEYKGTGVGLAICVKIAQAHGGRIWVESDPGAGATFFVTLPRGTAGPASGLPRLTASSSDP